ncbi:hypothetical protein ACLOJK_000044 [Asimina triloba]
MLQYIAILAGNFFHVKPSFFDTERLQGLLLESLSEWEEEWSSVHRAMPSLRNMSVSWCPKLEAFPIDDCGFKGGVWRWEEEAS